MSDPHPTRRDFFRATAGGAAGLALAEIATAGARPAPGFGTAKSCVFINMVGGPAHLDTFDPKPDAPADVRGPFRPIRTKVPGTHLSELFPKLATLTDKFSLIRSMYHTAPPVHECGFQLLNTGRLFGDGPEWPAAGVVAAHLLPSDAKWGYALLPDSRVHTGIDRSHGQWFGFFRAGQEHVSVVMPRANGGFDFRLDRLQQEAVSLVRDGVRFVTLNTSTTVFDAPSWDCHADGGSFRTTLTDIRDTVAPDFDTAFSALLTDLDRCGLLGSTLVVATGEFGRTPRLNSIGGRDHWAGCWSALVAGGGVKPGQIIGRSDRTGTEPADRPVSPQELVASIFHALGVPHDAAIPGPAGEPVAVYPGRPVAELF
jgi:uncharacterized protein (DUF1501 family)